MENRHYPRHNFHGNVRLQFNYPQWGWEGQTHILDSENISHGGILLKTVKPCDTGELCALYIRWGLFAIDIPLPGIVIRSEISSVGTSYETAIQFDGLDHEQEDCQNQLVESCANA